MPSGSSPSCGCSTASASPSATDAANGFSATSAQYLGTKTFLAETDLWVPRREPSGIGIPTYVFMAFQMMFAIITVALISGAISDRAKFAGWLLFAFGWVTLVYFPVAHWVWGGGFIGAKHPRARLRRWYRGAHQRRCGGARPWRWCSASGSAGRGRA